MSRIITAILLSLALSAVAFADDHKSKMHTAEGTAEHTTDTSHNPVTGTTTTTDTVETKNDAGHMTSKKKHVTKHDDHGHKMDEKTTTEHHE